MTADRCSLCPAHQSALCASLDPRELECLRAMGRRRIVAAGQVVLWAGDASSNCATVVEGMFKVTGSTAEGREQIVALAYPGDLIGQLFAEQLTRTVTAIADSELCVFPRAGFERLLETSPRMERALLERTVAALEESRERLLGLSRRNARERVAGFILELAERGDRVTLPVARGEMADLLGMTVETVSRQLARLRSDGVVRVERCGRDCAVLDRPRLAMIAGYA